MTEQGGRRRGAGRKPLDASEKKTPKTIWPSPAEQAFCLQLDDTVQDGIRHLIQQAISFEEFRRRASVETLRFGDRR